MEMEGLTGRFLRICEVISRLAYANLLWILFTVLGLGIFGFMPATVALFTVTRKWVMGDRDIPVFKTFWNTYRKEFFKSTLFGVVLFAIGYIIYIDLAFHQQVAYLHYCGLDYSFVDFSMQLFCSIFSQFMYIMIGKKDCI